MKFSAVLMAVVLCFLTVIPVSATESSSAEEAGTRYLCDADNDGVVSAADARIILRHSVGLLYTEGFGWMDYNDIIYCDADGSGFIDAPDARWALRTAVGLEESQSRSFIITDCKEPSCAYDAYINAECSLTGDTVSITISKNPHSLSAEAKCAGKGFCSECMQNVTVTPEHDFYTDPCRGIIHCSQCNYEEYFDGHHDYSSEFICKVCSESIFDLYNAFLTDFLIENGIRTTDPDGRTVYWYQQNDEYFTYALLYYPDELPVYIYCGTAITANEEIMYYDAYINLIYMTVELNCSMDDSLAAYCTAAIKPGLVTNGTSNGISINNFQSIEEMKGQEEAFGILAGAMSLQSFAWLRDFAQRTGFDDADLLFSNNPAFR